jgi:phosphohistidine phosphatase SixA
MVGSHFVHAKWWSRAIGNAIAILLVFVIEAGAQGQALQPQLQGPELLDELRKGGLVLLMRHMSTDSFVPEEGADGEDECANQRNLDERGRREAKGVGEDFERLGIPVGEVLTSPYCRCVDTGMLAFGRATRTQELSVFDELSGADKDARGKMIRQMLNTVPPENQNTVLITHTGTLLYSFGLQTTPEGIAHIFRPAEFGNAIYLGRVAPVGWRRLAGAAAPSP